MKVFIVDIDGTICTNTYGAYNDAIPFKNRINFINDLYDNGNIIKFFTARGSGTGIDWTEQTKKQFSHWGVKYHELIFKKPEGDIFIDDKSFNSEIWFQEAGVIEENLTPDNKFDFIDNALENQQKIINFIIKDINIKEKIFKISESIVFSLKNEGKIMFAGNGGSFADSQHLAAEFVSRFIQNRIPLASIALGTNSSNVSAIGNDFGFDNIFSREFEAIAKKQDLLIAISTSGNSKNIINLIEVAKKLGIKYFVFTGQDGGYFKDLETACLKVPSTTTAIIQQCHILIGHIIIGISEKLLFKKN